MTIGSAVPSGVNKRTTASQAINDWLSIQSTSQPVYLKHFINSSNVIQSSYIQVQISSTFASNNSSAGTIAGTYTFQGGDNGASYNSNLEALQKICGSSISPYSGGTQCSLTGGNFNVHDDGHIGVNMSEHRCHVWANKTSSCS